MVAETTSSRKLDSGARLLQGIVGRFILAEQPRQHLHDELARATNGTLLCLVRGILQVWTTRGTLASFMTTAGFFDSFANQPPPRNPQPPAFLTPNL